MEGTATSVLAGAVVTVATSVFKLINTSSGIRLFKIRICFISAMEGSREKKLHAAA